MLHRHKDYQSQEIEPLGFFNRALVFVNGLAISNFDKSSPNSKRNKTSLLENC